MGKALTIRPALAMRRSANRLLTLLIRFGDENLELLGAKLATRNSERLDAFYQPAEHALQQRVLNAHQR